MIITKPTLEQLVRLRRIADYQFGKGVGNVLIPDNVLVAISPNTLRIRQVLMEGKGVIVSLRASDYLYTLHLLGAELLIKNFKPPRFRIVISSSVKKFILEGCNVFCKHVVDYDPELRAGSEVIVVDEEDNLIGVGKLRVSPVELSSLKRGEAVRVRHVVGEKD